MISEQVAGVVDGGSNQDLKQAIERHLGEQNEVLANASYREHSTQGSCPGARSRVTEMNRIELIRIDCSMAPSK